MIFILLTGEQRVTIKTFLKSLKGSKGFSLTEVVIGGAVLAGLGLAGAQLFKEQKKSQKSVEHDQKLSLFHGHLQKLMENNGHCNATMKSVIPANSSIAAGANVPALRTCTSGCQDLNATMNTTTVANRAWDAYTAGAYVAGGTLVAAGNFIDGTNVWQVTSMVMTDTQTTTGPNRIRVSYRISPSIGTRTVTKDIFVNLRFFNNQFKECLNRQESTINNIQSDFCKSLNLDNGTVATDGRVAVWDDSTQTCVLQSGKTCAQYNLATDGIGEDGRVRCRPIIDTNDPNKNTSLQNGGTLTTCPGGQRPQVVWRDKKIQVVCVPAI